ncbi:MAG: CDP-diacylglycerol--glycerol-3-phosphate 3-phosphatidyltransferase [Actinobacteria bacterium]|nr:MAG: CDP-diacylglycerol--glycerol-3-phosphate 3-phosphatidyltransferase [Actinomycetota bacterium]
MAVPHRRDRPRPRHAGRGRAPLALAVGATGGGRAVERSLHPRALDRRHGRGPRERAGHPHRDRRWRLASAVPAASGRGTELPGHDERADRALARGRDRRHRERPCDRHPGLEDRALRGVVFAPGLPEALIGREPESLSPLGLGWPNVVSVLRVLLVPILVVLILAETDAASTLAAVVFVLGAMSDGLDGYLARRHGTSTRTGQWLDPLADKILVAAPVITLAAIGRFPAWAAIVIVAREVAIVLLRIALGLRGRSMPAASLAKAKTVAQVVAIGLYILPLSSGANGIKLAFLIVAVVFTVASGARYFAAARTWLRPSTSGTGRGPV